MKLTRIRRSIRLYDGQLPLAGRYATAVSLHSHTHESHESLSMVPEYAARIPFIANMFKSDMDRYQSKRGSPLDFSRIYWTPPVSPWQVLNSEQEHIHQMGLDALVSITDHDSITAALDLRRDTPGADIPVSVEWTAPVDDAVFHLGIHNMPPAKAPAQLAAMQAYTADPQPARLHEILHWLNHSATTLVVLNHPFWQAKGLAADQQEMAVRRFLAAHLPRIHAFELNGYRPWRENREVLRLAADAERPVISGGDRHGCNPNAILNLSQARTFDEFAHMVRDDRQSEVIIMPTYHDDVRLRQLEMAADIVRNFPRDSHHRPHWTDRVFLREDGGLRPLAYYWKRVGPPWVEYLLGLMRMLGHRSLRSALRLTVFNQGGVVL
ncbi:MAG: hypothetical protein JXQ27_18280 [Acidobacteria bacterium]|nr:hypothetical protein [Acidobacteriota bacterium]